MAKLTTKQITALGREFVLRHPEGVKFAEIVRYIMAQHPESAKNTVGTQVAEHLVAAYPSEITKPSRGLYVAVSGAAPPGGTPAPPPPGAPARFKEEDFYAPFANYLRDDLDEATAAEPIGGAALRDKWGTPDVVGVYRALRSDPIQFAPEIIAAEIKIDPFQSIVAFGQAIAYRLFATKAYIVMPTTLAAADQSRLESLCLLHGIGLVLFEAADAADPRFQIRVRAIRVNPDAFYANEFARRLHEAQPERFRALFQ